MTEIARLDEINKIVNEQVCQDTIEKLSDENLFNQYKESKSVEILSDKLTRKLEVYINGVNLSSVVSEILVDLIPPGTKGVIRGKAFNKIDERGTPNFWNRPNPVKSGERTKKLGFPRII